MTTSFKVDLRRDSVVIGKWKGTKYRVERLLGEGANGKVYLVQRDTEWLALKVGADSIDLQSEINVLHSLARAKRRGAEAFLHDVDDWQAPDGSEYPFYTMKYIRGTTLSAYLQRFGQEWFPLTAYNLLKKLAELHASGWIFGDLKVENVMVSDYGYVELVDFGGATAAGKSVRQFTEIYDRGYWNEGPRSADYQYDLFSFAVLCIQLHEPKRLHALSKSLLPQNRSADDLMGIVDHCPALRPLSAWLRRALTGRFRHAGEAAEAWRQLMHRKRILHRSTVTPGWLKGLAAVSSVLLAVSLYWLLRNVM
ncbi:serine/threonine protein kinase [Paenibacillus sp. J5C_2022]|uniref:serine/threonine protein kinase n=1 Tax=Paenibacillus sp. J5C2022 TaxID=2977129 RepID=UPI0021CE29EE|nr:serine/threonine protein kinase [Paenibacillus sp. J5C2022]MCU6710798.1 serine/threonine protein kinase [Paenibacillus sp. J5C2022]